MATKITAEVEIMNQAEAAEYLSERLPGSVTAPNLSAMTNSGEGPEFTRVGRAKIFARRDLDEWIDSQRKEEADDDETS